MKSEPAQPADMEQAARQCLSAQDKLSLYQDYHRSDNKSEAAQLRGDVDADSDDEESCTGMSKNRKRHLKKKRKQKR